MEIDDEVVQRALAAMRAASDRGRYSVDYVRAVVPGQFFSTRATYLEAVARDPSLFRAVELRRAELQREAARDEPLLGEVANNIDLLGEG